MTDDEMVFNRGTFELLGSITSAMAADAAFTTNALISSYRAQVVDLARELLRVAYALEKIPEMQRTIYIERVLCMIPIDHAERLVQDYERERAS